MNIITVMRNFRSDEMQIGRYCSVLQWLFVSNEVLYLHSAKLQLFFYIHKFFYIFFPLLKMFFTILFLMS